MRFLLIAEFLLGEGRDFLDIREGANAIRPHPRRIEALAVKRGSPVASPNLPLEALKLEGCKFIAPHPLNLLVPEIAFPNFAH